MLQDGTMTRGLTCPTGGALYVLVRNHSFTAARLAKMNVEVTLKIAPT